MGERRQFEVYVSENGFFCKLLGISNTHIGNVGIGLFSLIQVYFSIWHQNFFPLRVCMSHCMV